MQLYVVGGAPERDIINHPTLHIFYPSFNHYQEPTAKAQSCHRMDRCAKIASESETEAIKMRRTQSIVTDVSETRDSVIQVANST